MDTLQITKAIIGQIEEAVKNREPDRTERLCRLLQQQLEIFIQLETSHASEEDDSSDSSRLLVEKDVDRSREVPASNRRRYSKSTRFAELAELLEHKLIRLAPRGQKFRRGGLVKDLKEETSGAHPSSVMTELVHKTVDRLVDHGHADETSNGWVSMNFDDRASARRAISGAVEEIASQMR